ncbi:MAG: hypothetical protein ACO29O_06620 [Chitinophagaceae bacterium]
MDRIAKLKEFLLQKPDDSFLLHALGLEYLKIQCEDEAEALFRQVISLGLNATGTYYHLGKLLEKKGNMAGAIEIYQKGMDHCKIVGDHHSFRELQTAYEDLIY